MINLFNPWSLFLLQKNHYRELTEAAQQSLGHIPDQFVAYWILRFPNLLPYTWKKFEMLRDEPIFARYYPKDYVWSCPDDEDLLDPLNSATDDNWRAPILSSAEGDGVPGPDGARLRPKQDKGFWRPKSQSQYNKYNNSRWRKPREAGDQSATPPFSPRLAPNSPSRPPRLPTIDDSGPWRSTDTAAATSTTALGE